MNKGTVSPWGKQKAQRQKLHPSQTICRVYRRRIGLKKAFVKVVIDILSVAGKWIKPKRKVQRKCAGDGKENDLTAHIPWIGLLPSTRSHGCERRQERACGPIKNEKQMQSACAVEMWNNGEKNPNIPRNKQDSNSVISMKWETKDPASTRVHISRNTWCPKCNTI